MLKEILLMCSLLLGLFSPGHSSSEVRPPAVAGSFYPADSAQLSQVVAGHLNAVKNLPEIDGQLIALIVPHAGLVYSGPIAAYAYKLLESASVNKVILCGPSHRYGYNGLSVYGPNVSWKTPLGTVACDNNLCELILSHGDNFSVIPEAHRAEHCLEVQLPYLQTVLKDFKIVPIGMGMPSPATREALTKALEALPDDSQTVIIASSDWQHYRPASQGEQMDSLGLECIESLDARQLEQYLQSGEVEACGGAVISSVLKAAVAKGANKVKVLKYGDSGDITNDKSSVVGYAAVAIYRSGDASTSSSTSENMDSIRAESIPPVYELSQAQRVRLLEIARQSIISYLTTKTFPNFEVDSQLAEPGAAFVTLKRRGELRGCIGHTVARDALYRTVAACAVQAAVADPRFPPVQAEEVPGLDIEISVLTPLQEIQSTDDIEVGRDGLMITLGDYRGLLLPQVATEWGWDKTQFLQQTCRKAGLPKDAYKSPDAVIYRFQALVFGEK